VLAQAIIAMARALGMRVVAGGVEIAEQMSFLKDADCHELQAYYFSCPVEADQFERLLKDPSIVWRTVAS
jgi:EAL domain-containing protein (putative c-di-GMP-specific phosphodiesterase class I)